MVLKAAVLLPGPVWRKKFPATVKLWVGGEGRVNFTPSQLLTDLNKPSHVCVCVPSSLWTTTGRVCTCLIGRWPPEFWPAASEPRCLDSDRTPSPTSDKHKHYSENMKSDWWNQKRCWADVTHHSVALLGLQVFFIHLVEFVEHSGHNRKTPLLSSLQDWGRDGQLSFTSHSQVLMSVFTSYSSCDLFICYFILFLDVFWSDWTFLNITERLYRSPEEELLNTQAVFLVVLKVIRLTVPQFTSLILVSSRWFDGFNVTWFIWSVR